ncbi:MAG: hypothetical protein PWP04_1751 [Candidatus Atribacteria bacterium]|nr:hypothetical protein [Candidatus Atribacteria bacterium]
MDWSKAHRIFWDSEVWREKRRDCNWEKKVHTDLVWREIEPYLRPGKKVLDAGAGYGRYSIPLARAGCEVVHLDLSSQMIRKAQTQAEKEGLFNIHFVEGKVENLSSFADYSFDLVLSLDAPVSYAHPREKAALFELARVSREALIVSVVNRLGQLPVAIEMELKVRKSLAISWDFFRKGNWEHPQIFQAWEDRLSFLSRFIFPPFHAFMPEELVDMLLEVKFNPRRIVATGTLARLLPRRTLKKIVRDRVLYQDFLELSSLYDSQFEVLGVGSRVASGLLVVAERGKDNG